jgi:hypothetical protein
MYKVTFKRTDGKCYTYDRVSLLPTDSMAEKVKKTSARHVEEGGDRNPLFITQILSIDPSKE